MGVVYRAEDPLIHRTVAIKVLHPPRGLTADQVSIARERFRREAQVAGCIDHPHIIRIYDVGEESESGELFIVMEYLSGPSLEEMINGADLGLNKAAEIIGQIATGLDAAHEQGIVHRDIKPSNILFTDKGTAKIVDFGITQVAASSLTQSMTRLGTPSYMSPEQVTGMLLDSRADLFTFGVLCYEMLTGRKPFVGTDVVSIAYSIAHATPEPVSTANPQLPRSLDEVLSRMLDKEPSHRFRNAREFHQELLASLDRANAARTLAWRPAPPGRSRLFWGVGSAIALAAAVVVFLVAADKPGAPQAAPAIAAAAAPTRPAATPSRAPAPAPAPPAAKVVVPTTKLAISLTHRIRRGTLVVSVDGARVFSEDFSKAKLAISQTTTWDPVDVPVGTHKIRARVRAEDGTTYVSDLTTFELARGRELPLRIRFKDEKLTLERS